MVFPVGGAPDGTPKTRNVENDNPLSYRKIYNEAKGDESVFMQKVTEQYGSADNGDDSARVSQIFGFLKSADENDGTLDGNVTTQQLITDLQEEKTEVQINLILEFEHNYGAELNTYNDIKEKQGEAAADAYLMTCIKENIIGSEISEERVEYMASLYLMQAKTAILSSKLQQQELDAGINSTQIDEKIEQIDM